MIYFDINNIPANAKVSGRYIDKETGECVILYQVISNYAIRLPNIDKSNIKKIDYGKIRKRRKVKNV